MSRVVAPEQAQDAFRELAGARPDPGKVLVRFDDASDPVEV